jgi:G3E family GTPase
MVAVCVVQMQLDRQPKRRRKQLHDLSGVGSVGIVARGALDEYRFNMFMKDLLQEKSKDIFRCKGVLAVHVSGGRAGAGAGGGGAAAGRTACMASDAARRQHAMPAVPAPRRCSIRLR